MGTTALNSNHQALAQRADSLIQAVNQLIADFESDVNVPAEAAIHAKDAFVALCRADLALRDAITESTRGHYEELAREAVTGDRLPGGRTVLKVSCAWDFRAGSVGVNA